MIQKDKVHHSAREDIKDIDRYTLKRHGKIQRDKYLNAMAECFALLTNRPTLGRLRTDIKEGDYSKEYAKHVIFYLIRTEHIEIISVLHVTMIPQLHL